MTKEEFKSRIEDIIDDNRIYGWDTVTVLIMEEIDKTLPPLRDRVDSRVVERKRVYMEPGNETS